MKSRERNDGTCEEVMKMMMIMITYVQYYTPHMAKKAVLMKKIIGII
jgi:hypothetical protein